MGGKEALEKLKTLFENQKKYDSGVFIKIVEALTAEGGEEAYNFLGEFIMTSSNTLMIPHIIEILGRQNSDNVIPFIVETMKKKSTQGICLETAKALQKIGSKAAKDALELLYAVKLDPMMKELFKRTIDEIIRLNPIDYVWMPKLLLGSKMAASCIDAANALSRIEKEKALPYLIKEITNSDLLIRTVIVTAFGDIGSDSTAEKLIEVFKESSLQVSKKDDYIHELEGIKAHISEDKEGEAVLALLEKNKPQDFAVDIDIFITFYKEKNSDKVVEEGTKLLEKGLSGLPAYLVSILKAEPYKSEDAFRDAATATIKEVEVKTAEHNRIMSEVIIALGKILKKERGKEALIKDFLISESENLKNDELKARTIEILGEIPGEDVVDKLTLFTQDVSWKVREKAVSSLGEIKNAKSIDTLKKCCEDTHQDVSTASMNALGKIDPQAVIELFKSSNWRIRKLALQQSRSFNDPAATEAAKKLLDDEKYEVALEAIETIGSMKNDDSINVLSALVKKDGAAKAQEKVIEILEATSSPAVLKNIVEALEAKIPDSLLINLERALINILTKAEFDIENDLLLRIKKICVNGILKNDIKLKLSAISLAGEIRDLEVSDYNEIIKLLKGHDQYKSSKNPQERALVMASENAISLLERKIKGVQKLEEGRKKIESLFNEIFDKNETRSKNAIVDIWRLFSATKLSKDKELENEIWTRFSKRILMPETAPYIRESIAKIFGEMPDARSVPILLKFKDSKIHAERKAVEDSLKKLMTKFTREEIMQGSLDKFSSAPKTETDAPPPPQSRAIVKEPVNNEPPPQKENVKRKVLILDDALLIRNFYSKMLTQAGYITDTAKNGIEGIEKIKNQEFDVIILDLVLPDIDGLEILKQIPQITKNKKVKVIIVSSYVNENNTKIGLELGAVAIMPKPVDIDTLSSKIKIALR